MVIYRQSNYRTQHVKAELIIMDFLQKTRIYFNVCVNVKNLIKRKNWLTEGIKEFLKRKQEYYNCLKLLWDKYYDAVARLLEEAHVHDQADLKIEEHDKQYWD